MSGQDATGVKLQMIGGGRMGQALVGGLIDGGWATPDEVAIVEVLAEQRKALSVQYPHSPIADQVLPSVDAVVAVKPHHVVDVCRELESPTRVLSIAAGITIAAMTEALPAGTPVLRSMPNTPALVGSGAAGVAGGPNVSPGDLAWAVEIMSAVGVVEVVSESLIDSVTGLSGSGPAYVFLLAEAMADAGVAVGLTRSAALTLAKQTILGAGKMLVEIGVEPVELRAGVTTPAGTTAAGLAALEAHQFRAAVASAVKAATERSQELGEVES